MTKTPKTKAPAKRKKREKNLSGSEKQAIVAAYGLGVSPSLIAGILRREPHTVSAFFSTYERDKDLPPKVIVKKSKFSPAVLLAVKDVAKTTAASGRPVSYMEMLQELEKNFKEFPNEELPSVMTLYRMVHKEGQFKSVKQLIKPPLTKENMLKRLEYAQSWFVDGKFVDRNVIWTDEVMVKSHPENHRQWVLVRGDALKDEYPVRTKLHMGGNSVMFWGCISKNRTGQLVSLQGHVNAESYLETLKNNIYTEYKAATKKGKRWVVMQDNAPSHTAKVVTAEIERLKIPMMKWPPYSPDLNPIENIWAWMKHNLHHRYETCRSAEAIEEVFFEIWNSITPELCQKFAGNYEKRLLAVIAAKGGHTRY